MPPRRSCFNLFLRGLPPHPEVSMPPRRSCFPRRSGWPPRGSPAFQCHHGVPASWGRRPAPRRRAHGFNATTAFLLRRGRSMFLCRSIGFQCHHGVPASRGRSPRPAPRPHVSMPPRRSCFAAVDLPQPGDHGFQCHHGVPASRRGLRHPAGPDQFQCHHGVPASSRGRTSP